MSLSDLILAYDMASLEKARAEGREGRWWVLWFLKKGILLFLKLVLITPVLFLWRWTGEKNTGLVRFAKFIFFSLIYYCILYALVTAPFRSSNSSTGIQTDAEVGMESTP